MKGLDDLVGPRPACGGAYLLASILSVGCGGSSSDQGTQRDSAAIDSGSASDGTPTDTGAAGDTGAPGDTGTGPSDTATEVLVDAPADGAALCDGTTCGAAQVCVVPCCAPPCKPARPHCVDIPSTCGGVPGCPCMAPACAGVGCGGMIDGRLQCVCF